MVAAAQVEVLLDHIRQHESATNVPLVLIS